MDLDCQFIKECDLDTFTDIVYGILDDRMPPNNDFFKSVVECALQTYQNENEKIRPKDENGLPGGVLDLRDDRPVIIVPDLHARRYFVKNLLSFMPNLALSQQTVDDKDPTLDVRFAHHDEDDSDDEDEYSDTDESDYDDEIGLDEEYDDELYVGTIVDDAEPVAGDDEAEDDDDSDISLSEESKPDIKDNSAVSSETADSDLPQDNCTILELLEQSRIILLFLGDGVHGEASYAQRWFDAFVEFTNSFSRSPNMDEEIADSFNLMIVVMLLKIRWPNNVHFLKGNHENIANETGDGNYAFGKFANEGQMVLTYFRRNYDEQLLSLYYNFEKNLPLFAVGRNFLASHAQPLTFYDYEDILNYRTDGDVVCGLTWTDNFQSVADAIDEMLDYYIPENDAHTYYFAGHRPIKGLYCCIDKNRFVQIHNPRKQIICQVDQNGEIDLERDIFELFVEDK